MSYFGLATNVRKPDVESALFFSVGLAKSAMFSISAVLGLQEPCLELGIEVNAHLFVVIELWVRWKEDKPTVAQPSKRGRAAPKLGNFLTANKTARFTQLFNWTPCRLPNRVMQELCSLIISASRAVNSWEFLSWLFSPAMFLQAISIFGTISLNPLGLQPSDAVRKQKKKIRGSFQFSWLLSQFKNFTPLKSWNSII